MKISKIQSIGKRRYLLLLEDDRAIEITEREIAFFQLAPGVQVSEEMLFDIEDAAAVSVAQAVAVQMIAGKPISKGDLTKKLMEKGVLEEIAQAALDRLEEAGIIDDGAIAKTVGAHYAGRGYGPRRIEEELYRRGIGREFWDVALLEGAPASQRAADYLKKKAGQYGLPEDRRERHRMLDGLRRRGFFGEEIEAGIRLYQQWLEDL